MEEALALAKAYTDSQRVCYTETVTLSYDGKSEGTDILGDGNLYVKVYNSDIDTDKLSKIIVTVGEGVFVLAPSSCSVEKDEGSASWCIRSGDGTCIAFYTKELDEGVYVLANPDIYVKSMIFEFDMPIDPKYLPAGIGYDKMGTAQVLQRVVIEASPMEELGGIAAGIFGVDIAPETVEKLLGADKAKVTLDDQEYICTAKIDNGYIQCGNFGFANGGNDTGEPFFISIDIEAGQAVFAHSVASTYRVSVAIDYEEAVPIPVRYLPKDFVPTIPHIVLEDPIPVRSGANDLTDANRVKISNLLYNTAYDIVKITFTDSLNGGTTHTNVYNRVYQSNAEPVYETFVSSGIAMIAYSFSANYLYYHYYAHS